MSANETDVGTVRKSRRVSQNESQTSSDNGFVVQKVKMRVRTKTGNRDSVRDNETRLSTSSTPSQNQRYEAARDHVTLDASVTSATLRHKVRRSDRDGRLFSGHVVSGAFFPATAAIAPCISFRQYDETCNMSSGLALSDKRVLVPPCCGVQQEKGESECESGTQRESESMSGRDSARRVREQERKKERKRTS